jgi:hypothetical protein
MTDRSAESAPMRVLKTDWGGRFLEVLRSTCNVRLSADAAGIDRDTAYRRRQRDPEFARLWAQAEQDGIDVLEAQARARALSQSDTLLIFLLKAHRPEVYRERVDIRLDMKIEAQRIARDLGVSVEGLYAEAERILEISGL